MYPILLGRMLYMERKLHNVSDYGRQCQNMGCMSEKCRKFSASRKAEAKIYGCGARLAENTWKKSVHSAQCRSSKLNKALQQ